MFPSFFVRSCLLAVFFSYKNCNQKHIPKFVPVVYKMLLFGWCIFYYFLITYYKSWLKPVSSQRLQHFEQENQRGGVFCAKWSSTIRAIKRHSAHHLCWLLLSTHHQKTPGHGTSVFRFFDEILAILSRFHASRGVLDITLTITPNARRSRAIHPSHTLKRKHLSTLATTASNVPALHQMPVNNEHDTTWYCYLSRRLGISFLTKFLLLQLPSS